MARPTTARPASAPEERRWEWRCRRAIVCSRRIRPQWPGFSSAAEPGGNMIRRLASMLAVAAALFVAPAVAADLKVISAGAVRGLIAQIIDDYSRQTGQKFDFTIGTTGQLRNIIASGQPADLVIVSVPLMGEL